MYALVQRDRKIRVSSVILLLALLALFTSTTLYFVYTILSTGSSVLSLLVYSAEALWSLPPAQALEVPRANLFKNYGPAQACARTAALSINVRLPRSSLLARRISSLTLSPVTGNRAIKGISIAFLLVTFSMGLVDIEHTCIPDSGGIASLRTVNAGFLYSNFSYGVAASALSFGTNLWATLLVGYKALASRRFTRKHAIAGSLGLQTEHVLLLLVESGAFYCAVWAVVIVWQIGEYVAADASAGVSSFWVVYGDMIAGALVPVIVSVDLHLPGIPYPRSLPSSADEMNGLSLQAMYPNVIVVLVALNRSQIERGFGAEREPEDVLGAPGPGPGPARMPALRTLTITVGSVAETCADVVVHGGPDVNYTRWSVVAIEQEGYIDAINTQKWDVDQIYRSRPGKEYT
ncbi:hypothetical protein GSI_00006 [Ganoderma sinense ZZ0214-1]|uniref:Uncharacterized protein n=1 Tax=Ganoderma sinense ZZ0214-1 TaxID=1077348 RepID=A0A2G8SRW5_9APHY|nr:hypothetical protein GSI_00006 [Ganoderma sinense ZZ0214-1]